MLEKHLRWRLAVGLAMVIGGSFVAGCCGGIGDNGGGCTACAQAKAALGASEAGAIRCSGRVDASHDANGPD